MKLSTLNQKQLIFSYANKKQIQNNDGSNHSGNH